MIILHGMYGVGDCIHQRAVVREAMVYDNNKVVLETFYYSMYADLLDHGLQLRRLRKPQPRIRELTSRFPTEAAARRHPLHTRRVNISYNRESILRHGNILAAQFATAGFAMPEKPDFSMPVPKTWRDMIRARIGYPDKPIMVYRPVVLNNVWRSESRSPCTAAYAELFESIRADYHVVSVAHIGLGGEHIHGSEMPADTKFHAGELAFEEMAGLFAEAKLAFTCPGFAPVLAQSVGTPTVIVYGGNESFRTTNSVGAHLAPTLALEPINPCACHLKDHDCDKTIDVPAAIKRLKDFTCGL